MEVKDYYDILGVSQDASEEEIQRAYRQLARQYHPDINKDAEAEDLFKDIGEAYEVLKEADKRAAYDRYGASWKAAQQNGGAPPSGYEDFWYDRGASSGPNTSSFSDVFGNLFGSGSRRRTVWGEAGAPEWEMRGADQEARLVLTLEEAAKGGQREITLTEPATGQAKTFMVTIPRGIRPGQRLRLGQQGGQGTGGAPGGDLYLQVEVLPHPRFRLEGPDLHTTLAVAPWEAALGTDVRLATLDGAVTVKVPPGSSSGRTMRLKGKGFPNRRGSGGDLYVDIKIVVPSRLTEEEQQLFEQLATISPFRPRP